MYSNYLKALCKSKAEGARVTHYYAWSFMDNFEWCGRPRGRRGWGVCVCGAASLHRCRLSCALLCFCPSCQCEAANNPITKPTPTKPHTTLPNQHRRRQGYTERFGVVAVDFNNGTLARTVKDSGRFLSEHFFKESA
jgi:hypothetical protein